MLINSVWIIFFDKISTLIDLIDHFEQLNIDEEDNILFLYYQSSSLSPFSMTSPLNRFQIVLQKKCY